MAKRISKTSFDFVKWAKEHRLKVKKDDCDDFMVPGKLGQIFEYDPDENLVAAMYMPPRPTKGWKIRREQLVAAGAKVLQNGDVEGTVIFDASDGKLTRLAAKLLGIRTKKEVSPERLEALKANLERARAQRRV